MKKNKPNLLTKDGPDHVVKPPHYRLVIMSPFAFYLIVSLGIVQVPIVITHCPKSYIHVVVGNHSWEGLFLRVPLSMDVERCAGYKAALVLLQQRWCLAQGHISLYKCWSLIVIPHGMHSWQPDSPQRYRSSASSSNVCLCLITCSLLRLTHVLFVYPKYLSLRTTYFSFFNSKYPQRALTGGRLSSGFILFISRPLCVLFGRLFYAIIVAASIVMFFSFLDTLYIVFGMVILLLKV